MARATAVASQLGRPRRITSSRLALGEEGWLVPSGPERGLRHTEWPSALRRRQRPAVTPGRLMKPLVPLSGRAMRHARCRQQDYRLLLSPPSRQQVCSGGWRGWHQQDAAQGENLGRAQEAQVGQCPAAGAEAWALGWEGSEPGNLSLDE